MVLKVLNSPVRLNRKVSLSVVLFILIHCGDIQSMKVLILLVMILPFTFLIFYWCHLTNSLGKIDKSINS